MVPVSFASEIERHRKLLAEWNKLTEQDKHPIKPAPKGQRKQAQRKKIPNHAENS